MKKLINLIALVMLVSVNVLTPFSYADVEDFEPTPENNMENSVEEEGVSDDEAENSVESGEIIGNDETIPENNERIPEIDETTPENNEISSEEDETIPENNEVVPDNEETAPEDDGKTVEDGAILESDVITSENDEIESNENLELPEIQGPITMDVISGTSVTLITGQQFNVAIKKLAGQSGATYSTTNRTIKQILYTGTIPEGVTTTGLSMSGSTYPVTAWFMGGIVYYTSEAETIYLNPDSSRIFYDLEGLTGLDIDNWDTSKVTNMSEMFRFCSGLIVLDTSNWNTSKVTKMNYMFAGCNSLTNLNLSSWDTSKVIDMSAMFLSCKAITGLDVSNFNTSNVTDMNYMFHSCNKLEAIYTSSSFVTTKLTGSTSSSFMFSQDTKLVGGNGTKYNSSKIDKTYARIDNQTQSGYFTDPNEIIIRFMIGENNEYTTQTVKLGEKAKQPSTNPVKEGAEFQKWITKDGEDYDFNTEVKGYTELYAKFNGGIEAVLLPGKDFNQTIKKLISAYSSYSSSNDTIKQIVKTGNIPDGVNTGIISIPYSDNEVVVRFTGGIIYYYTQAETIYMNPDSSYMFYYLQGLTGLDLSNRDTSRVTNMSYMFGNCSKLESLNINNFNTSSVTNMSYMFSSCNKLESLDINNFDTSNVTNMSSMFSSCNKLESLDISSFNTSRVTNTSYMFSNCSNLSTVYTNTGFVTNGVTGSSNMFSSDTNLVGGNGTKFNGSQVDKKYAKIDSITQSGYFTDKSAITINFIIYPGIYESQRVQYGGHATQPETDPTREGTTFKRRVDKNGDEYDFNLEITKYTEIYADFNGGGDAILLPGQEFNQTIKRLAGDDSATYSTINTGIKQIIQVQNIPEGVTTGIISSPYSDNEVVARFTGGILYYYTDSETIYMNPDSSYMFAYCSGLVELDFSQWNTSEVIKINSMLNSCNSLSSLSLSGWDFSNISSSSLTSNMSMNKGALKKLDLTNTKFAGSMYNAFGDLNKLLEIKLDGMDTSNVTDMSYTFSWLKSLTGLDLSHLDTSNVTDMHDMFDNDTQMKKLNLSNLNTSKVTNMSNMFYSCSNLEELNLSGWDFSSLSNIQIRNMGSLGNLKKLDVTNTRFSGSMYETFYNFTNLEEIKLDGIDTSHVTDMRSMFSYCNKLTSLNLKDFDTSNVTGMYSMFSSCTSLTGLDLSNWDTSNVTNIGNMFGGCSKLEEVNLSGWDFRNIDPSSWKSRVSLGSSAKKINMTNAKFSGSMSYAFNYSCNNLEEIKLDGADTSNVTNMQGMFLDCRGLQNLNLSSFDTSKVTNMSSMFSNCYSLETIYASTGFVTNGVTGSNNMFYSTTKLVGGNGTKFNSSYVDKTYALIDKPGQMGYFTDGSGIIVKFLVGQEEYEIQFIGIGEKAARPTDPQRNGANFEKWITENGDEYDFNTEVRGYTELYAKFDIGGNAMLLPGQQFNQTLKRLSGQTGAGYSSNNYTIKQIIRTGNIQEGATTGIISLPYPYSENEVVAWFDGGTIYYYTEADTIYMNPDSSYMFNYMQGLTGLDSNNWNSSKVTNMYDLFYDCNNLIGLDLSKWDTSNVTNMIAMFGYCSSLTGLDLSSFDTSNVTNMTSMFSSCNNLEEVNLSGWDFRKYNRSSLMSNMSMPQSVKKLNMANTKFGTSMNSIFYYTNKLEEVNLSGADTSNVTDMYQMFYNCSSLKNVNLSNIDTSEVTNMIAMFYGCNSLTGLDLSNFDTSSVTNMQAMFTSCSKLEEINLDGWDLRNLNYTSNGGGFFSNTPSLRKISTRGWKIPQNFNDWIYRHRSAYLSPIEEIDVTDWDLSITTNINGLFGSNGSTAGKLTTIKGLDTRDTSNITNMGNIFYGLSGLESLDLSNWDTSNVTNMSSMFINCNNLTSLDLSNFDTSNVTDMSSMFVYCRSLTSLDLSNWDTSNATNMGSMFNDMPKLRTIYASDKFVTSGLTGYNTSGSYMFYKSTSIVGGNGTKFDSGYIDKTYALIDKVGQTGYFTDKNAITVKFINTMDGTETYATFAKGQELTPSKVEGYHVAGGYLDEAMTQAIDLNKGVDSYSEIYVKYEHNGSSGGGGGGGSTKPDTPKDEQQPADTSEQVPQNDNSVSSGANAKDPENEYSEQTPQNDSNTSMDSSDKSSEGQTYTQEFQEAYEFAKGNGITTMPTIQKANMEGKLTRIAMAKMLSQYAINVLGKTPDTSKTIKFKDVTSKKNADYDNGVTLAYQLGIMGQNMPGNNFRPNDEVTRAEFATALSRMAYNTSDGEYKSTSKYYIHHMEKLVNEGIITKDDPNMKELRGYVMIMLMRSAK